MHYNFYIYKLDPTHALHSKISAWHVIISMLMECCIIRKKKRYKQQQRKWHFNAWRWQSNSNRMGRFRTECWHRSWVNWQCYQKNESTESRKYRFVWEKLWTWLFFYGKKCTARYAKIMGKTLMVGREFFFNKQPVWIGMKLLQIKSLDLRLQLDKDIQMYESY